MRNVFAIGYSKIKTSDIRDIVVYTDSILVDVRSNPFSRWRPELNRKAISEYLGKRYMFAGDTLGGRGKKDFVAGFNALPKKSNLILMCSEYFPTECHRHRILLEAFPDGIHIIEDELVTATELQRSHDDDDDYELVGELSDYFK